MGDFYSNFQANRKRTATASTPQRQGSDLESLRAQVAELEKIRDLTGAGAIEQDTPGLFRKVLDVISRPNYAVVSLVEDVMEGESFSSTVAGVFQELFSGIGGLKGQKKAFGQLLEEKDFDTTYLSEVIPWFENTWVGNFNTRGTAGLALDIFTDPLTYVSFGTAGFGRKIFSEVGGEIALSPKGWKTYQSLREGLGEFTEATEREVRDKMWNLAKDDKSLVDLGGMKFGTKNRYVTVPFTEGVGSKMSKIFGEKLVSAARVVGAEDALEKSAAFYNGVTRGLKKLFHPLGELSILPRKQRTQIMDALRKNRSSSAYMGVRVTGALTDLESQFMKLPGDPESIAKRFYEKRIYNRGELTPEELEVFNGVTDWLDNRFAEATNFKTLDEGFRQDNYFPVQYKNYTDEDLIEGMYLAQSVRGGATPNAASQFKKSLFGGDYEQAMELSKTVEGIQFSARSKGSTKLAVPLEVDFDLFSNLRKYAENHIYNISAKTLNEDMIRIAGRKYGNFTSMKAFVNLHKNVAKVAAKDRALIDEWKGRNNEFTLKGRESELDDLELTDIEKATTVSDGSVQKAVVEARRIFERLQPNGRKQMMKELIRAAGDSPNQLAQIKLGLDIYWDKYAPKLRAYADGDITPEMVNYGQRGAMVIRGGQNNKIWGDEAVVIPKVIAEKIDNINSKIINTKEQKAVGKLIKGYDQVLNFWKIGIYSFSPASAGRDAMSNILNSFLDLGVSALNPKTVREVAEVMTGRSGKVGNYTYDQVREQLVTLGVNMPRALRAELVGKFRDPGATSRTKLFGKAVKWRDDVLGFRGKVDESTRAMHYINLLKDGFSPEDAARKVNEFNFDYGALSKFEREVALRAVPFYTFTRKNLELQLKQLMRNPGRQINPIKGFRGRTDENEALASWEAEGFKIRLDRDGKTLHTITGLDFPLRNLDQVWRGDLGSSLRTWVGMSTPILKSIIEPTVRKEFFTGKDITRIESQTIGRFIDWTGNKTPRALKNWLGYKKTLNDAGQPEYSFDGVKFYLLFKSYVFSRILSTTDRQFEKYLKDPLTAQSLLSYIESGAILDPVAGFRSESFDLEGDAYAQRLRERRRQLRDSIERRGYGEQNFFFTFTDTDKELE